MSLLMENTLSGPAGAEVTDTSLAASSTIGTVTIHASGDRAVYDDTRTVYDQPGIRVDSGLHRGDTPRLRIQLPDAPWSVRWYTHLPPLGEPGHGTGEVRSMMTWADGTAWVVHPTAADNLGARLHQADLAAPSNQWDVQDGTAVDLAGLLRVEARHDGADLEVRAFPGHSTEGERIHIWEDTDLSGPLELTGYRWRRDLPLLMWGDQGAQVRTLQNELLDLGYSLGQWGADGDFSEATHNAILAFQADHGLDPVDGAAGPETRAAMAMSGGHVPPPVWICQLAVAEGEWIGPVEEPPEPPPRPRAFTVGVPI